MSGVPRASVGGGSPSMAGSLSSRTTSMRTGHSPPTLRSTSHTATSRGSCGSCGWYLPTHPPQETEGSVQRRSRVTPLWSCFHAVSPPEADCALHFAAGGDNLESAATAPAYHSTSELLSWPVAQASAMGPAIGWMQAPSKEGRLETGQIELRSWEGIASKALA